MNKKIYIVSKYGLKNIGGLERVNSYLYKYLSEKYEVGVLEERKKKFKHGDWLFQSVYMSLKLYFIRNKFVIGTSWHSFLYPCNLSFHHGTTKGINSNLNNTTTYSKRISLMERLGAIFAKTNIAVGENCKEELIKYYKIPEKKILVLNNFVDDSNFTPAQHERNEKDITILFSGRLEERKGIKELIELSDYLESIEGIKLKIATMSTESELLEHFNNKKNTSFVTGLTVNDMPAFYNSGDILFFPTHYEGFTLATLEALCCGLPVIGTKWAIGKELQDYEFCKVINDINIPEIIEQSKILYSKFNNKRDFIHKTVSERFGEKAYKEKLFKIVEERY